jgi:hypothetical protein
LTFDVVTLSGDYDGLGTDLPADSIIVVESSSFTIAAGDTIFVSLSRDVAASPSFAAEIGAVRIGGILIPG